MEESLFCDAEVVRFILYNSSWKWYFKIEEQFSVWHSPALLAQANINDTFLIE